MEHTFAVPPHPPAHHEGECFHPDKGYSRNATKPCRYFSVTNWWLTDNFPGLPIHRKGMFFLVKIIINHPDRKEDIGAVAFTRVYLFISIAHRRSEEHTSELQS